ncbi:Tetracycline resistance protein from transposon [Venustampulla echinocandica]|uniref:Tetracycline resistance protein from transposon n=1 Tax=Venustampulla echinocandica TaxID=2656787 RepID=A0A370TGT1_9HELO|nr:Tetracycline resistance protein from transposon [Venustampulla echinocandica]RDL34406.1 Tetracycline resistance protein from transposon [Venustampulla echinocandica]
MSSSQPRIAIVGGGPAGLTTGLLLHKRGVPFTIFELRQKPTDEELAKPSGMLDLHEESGIAALKECGLFDEILQITGDCSEAQKVSDKNGNILHTDDGDISQRPEISRHALSKLLSSHIPADQIRWGYKLLAATKSMASGSGLTEIQLDFGPRGKQTFDLVIGADGAWSKVRNLLSDTKPYYAGTQNITLTIREVTKKYPHLSELVGLGSFAALGDRHGVMSQRGPQDSARIYIFLTIKDEHYATTLAGQTALAAKERVLGDVELLSTWGTAIKELVTIACDEEVADNPGNAVDIHPMYVLPVGNAWEHKIGATVIGDAAHLMGPWAGEGVNLAMWDSQLLAHAIIKAYETETARKDAASFQSVLDPLIEAFEVDMVARAQEKAEESSSNGQMLFGEDGATAFAEFFRQAYAGAISGEST